jgi:hypothetical protein
MSTVSVDEQLYLRTIELARTQGKTIEEFVTEALRKAVGEAIPQAGSPRRSTRNGLPVMVANGAIPVIDPTKVRESIEEEGF